MNAQSKIDDKVGAASFSADLVAAFSEIGGATKDKINPAFKSKYADIGAVIEAIKPSLGRYNMTFYQRSQPSEDGVLVQTVVRHSSGEELDLGTLYVPANKKDAQSFGSALTYARRYALMTAFGVPAEDEDGNSASASQRPSASAPPPVPITDEQRDLIQQLAGPAGKTVQGICEAYKIASLKELTFAKADNLIQRLRAVSEKEPA